MVRTAESAGRVEQASCNASQAAPGQQGGRAGYIGTPPTGDRPGEGGPVVKNQAAFAEAAKGSAWREAGANPAGNSAALRDLIFRR
jgi:hypothetical protein